MRDVTHTAIVGGGVTGLALGYHLARAGVPHVLLEAAARPGGVMRSGRVEGHVLDWGPQRTRLTAVVRELIDGLSLSGELVIAPRDLPLFVYRAGRLREVPFSAGAFVRSDIVPLRAKLRLLLEPLTGAARDSESVAEYFTRKLGRSLYDTVAGPLYGGLYASDPADMIVGLSLGHVLREFGVRRSLLLPLLRRGTSIHPPAACSFREGMQTLPEALYAADRSNVELATPVIEVRRSGGGWLAITESGEVLADRLVLSVPAAAAARLLARVVPSAAESLARLTYNPLAVVHLHAETDMRGLGYQVALSERLATRGVTFNGSLFARSGVFTAYLGGSRAPEVVGWSDEELSAVAVREFLQVSGLQARPLSVQRTAMPAWDASWEALRSLKLPAGIRIAANWESRPGLPGRLAQAKRLAAELSRDFGVEELPKSGSATTR